MAYIFSMVWKFLQKASNNITVFFFFFKKKNKLKGDSGTYYAFLLLLLNPFLTSKKEKLISGTSFLRIDYSFISL